MPHTSRHDATDILAFSIILLTAKKLEAYTYPGISTLLDAILRDATLYFLLMFGCQVLLVLFLFFAPVGDI